MSLTIVMYHYVRDLVRSRYPEIRGRTLHDFKEQLEYIASRYEVVTMEQVIAGIRGEERLPENSCWLTFDDGYADHFQNVFPLLEARRWQGSFFPPARPILEGRVLDVNKIHFILASEPNVGKLVGALRREVEVARADGEALESWESYVAMYMTQCPLDSPEVLFLKLMLQRGLPEGVRKRICGSLFSQFVTSDEEAFAAELYLSVDQARTMVRCGMAFGSHGYSHEWLASLDSDAQSSDIDRSLSFLKALGVPSENWAICYPYGSYSQETLNIVRQRGGALGLTTRDSVADVDRDSAWELPRVDTISLPAAPKSR